MVERLSVHFEGREILVAPGSNLAAALAGAGLYALRFSLGGEARGALCGMGICHECRMTVDGRAHVRACLVECSAGMRVERGRA